MISNYRLMILAEMRFIAENKLSMNDKTCLRVIWQALNSLQFTPHLLSCQLILLQPKVKGVKGAWKTPPIEPPEVKASTPKILPIAAKKYSSSSEQDSTNIERESSTLLSSSHQSSSGSIVSQERPSSKIRLTGDQKTDEDILAFMKARQELLRRNKSKR